MADYTKITNFAAKDTLPSGDTNKKVRGTEINDEFVAIATAVATKADKISPVFSGTPTAPSPSLAADNTQLATTEWVRDIINAIEPVGTIKAYAGTAATVPAGWAVCDGSNGTLNLRDRFIVGYALGGNFGQNATGGNTAGSATLPISITTSSNGSHNHGGFVQGTVLTTAQLPPHTHDAIIPGSGSSGYINSALAAVPVSTGATSSTGSGAAHDHGILTDAAHQHTVTGTVAVPGFFALMFIQKIALL